LINVPFAEFELWRLHQDLKVTKRAAFAEGTHKNHLTQWRAYFAFCFYFDLEALPASLQTICLFCVFLGRTLTASSVRNYLSGVKFLHVASGFDFPPLSSFMIKLTLRGIERGKLHCPSRAPPVTPAILRLIVQPAFLVSSSAEDITFSCAFLFAFFLFSRISNLVPASVQSFDPRKALLRGDILPAEHGLVVVFRWSKTNQTGSRRLVLPLVRVPNSSLCPVAMFQRMCSLLPAGPTAPAFVLPSISGKLSPVTKSQFVQTFRARLRSAGVPNWASFRGHSFRRGGANWAFTSGVPGEMVQVFGDWSSDAYKCYLESDLPAKLRVSRFMSQACSAAQ